MNVKTVLFCLLGILFIGLTSFSSYKKAEKKDTETSTTKIDVVHHFPPAHESSPELQALLERFNNSQSYKERVEILNEESSKEILTPYIAGCVRSEGYNCYIEGFTFGYGGGIADSVTYAKGGWIQTGFFGNELFARITGGDCFGEGMVMFVACGNLTSFKLFKPEEEDVIASVLDHPLFAATDKN